MPRTANGNRYRVRRRSTRTARRPRRAMRRVGKRKLRITRMRVKGNIAPDKCFAKMRSTSYLSYIYEGQTGATSASVIGTLLGNDFQQSGSLENTVGPPGLDVYASMYSRYRILGSKVKISMVSNPYGISGVGSSAAMSQQDVIWGLYPQAGVDGDPTDGSLPNELGSFMNEPYGSWRQTAGYQGRNKSSINRYLTTKKVFGTPISQEDDYAGVFGVCSTGSTSVEITSNPLKIWFWRLWASMLPSQVYQPGVPNYTTVYLNFIVQITYYVQFEGRRVFDRTTISYS